MNEKYEYCYVLAEELPRLKEQLHDAGSKGWRLVNFVHVPDNSADGGYYAAIIEKKVLA